MTDTTVLHLSHSKNSLAAVLISALVKLTALPLKVASSKIEIHYDSRIKNNVFNKFVLVKN